MEPQQPKIDELVSGMLDGELSNAEARRLDAEMKANPAIQQRLDELAAMRSSLLSGRPTGRLPKSFAARVTDLAKERAAELGDSAPDWLYVEEKRPSESRTPTGSFARPIRSDAAYDEYKSRAWIPIASIVAVICVGFVIFLFPQPQPQPFANLPPFERDTSSGDGLASEGNLVGGGNLVGEDNTASAKELLQSQLPKIESSSVVADAAMELPKEKIEIVSPTSTMENKIATNERASDAPKTENEKIVNDLPNMAENGLAAVENGLVGTAKPKRPNGSAPIASAGKMLFTVSVDMDRVAFENDALDQIFTKHGIAAIEELAINEDQLRALLSSGIAGSVSKEGNSIVLLKGTAKNIGNAVMEIYSQFKDFPAIGINVVVGKDVEELEKQFGLISVAATPVSKRLTVKNEGGLFSRFSEGKLKAKKQLNEGKAGNSLLSQDGESLMLLLIREVE